MKVAFFFLVPLISAKSDADAEAQTFIQRPSFASPSLFSSPGFVSVPRASSPAFNSPSIVSTPRFASTPVAAASPLVIAPQTNCSVEDTVLQVQVCTPAFQTSCSKEDLAGKVIVEKDQCETISKTICTESSETVDQTICTYAYKTKQEQVLATSAEVTFEQQCNQEYYQICQPVHHAVHHAVNNRYGYGAGIATQHQQHQACSNVPKKICTNVPKVSPKQETVTIAYPVPEKTCAQAPISVPRVTCEEVETQKCFKVPEVVDKVEKVDKCEVTPAPPTCRVASLTLPKQTCITIG